MEGGITGGPQNFPTLYYRGFLFYFILFWFFGTGFLCAALSCLETPAVDQSGFVLTEIRPAFGDQRCVLPRPGKVRWLSG